MSAVIQTTNRQQAEALIRASIEGDYDWKMMNICLRSSENIYVGFVDGEMACVWGLIPPTILSCQAYLWLYTTDLVQDNQITFIRQSQIAVKKMLESYEMIVGHVGNEKAKRWLKWLGAEFHEASGREVFCIRKKKDG